MLHTQRQRGIRRLMGRLPREARDSLMRAWTAILEERHPGVVWVPVEEAQAGEPASKREVTPQAVKERAEREPSQLHDGAEERDFPF